MIPTLGKRILLFVFAVLLVTLAVDNVLTIRQVSRDYRESLAVRSRLLGKELSSGIEKVLSLGINLNEIEGMSNRCRQVVASDPEIVYCVIVDANRNPLYSHDPLSPSPVTLSEVQAGNTATSHLFNPRFGHVYDTTTRILAPDGTTVGWVSLGFPESALSAMPLKLLRYTLIVLVVASLIVLLVLFFFVRINLTVPIEQLCRVARRVAGGDFNAPLPKMSTLEFASLANALESMAKSLRDRDLKIQDSYTELELSNRELQSSYEQQERITDELAANREMYRTLLEHASDAILVVDDVDRILLINRAAENFFGVTRAVAVNEDFLTLLARVHGGRIEREESMLCDLREGRINEFELNFVRPQSGERVVGSLRSSAMVDPGGKRMTQMTIRDITRDKEIKEHLEQVASDLQNLNTMKNSFLGMVSHELKTPLTVVSGYSELILSGVAGRADESVLSMVRYISDASDRLTAIVRDIVDVTLLDRRQMPLRVRLVDFNELIRTATNELEYFLHVRHQTLQLDLDSDLPQVFCDPDRMFQVVTNLVGNAVKFTPDNGTITLTTRLVRIMRAPDKSAGIDEVETIDTHQHTYVEMVVRDSGIGIDVEEQLQVFEKFYEIGKIEEHFTGKMAFRGRGTGLGLTIVKGIVDRHGGAIWVESEGHHSEKFCGSAFFVLIPLLPPVDPTEII
ncbi:MAG: PAS domain-containing sensor histidine kinase [Deltaproteobacteria bacterium HGW-Deltaproteobacteria-4]|nr:MAG: PAS domain-containing sensor histidine kinase [Deltaproteobacteria bacterium HGW-Deltaproteobacteria-4]